MCDDQDGGALGSEYPPKDYFPEYDDMIGII
jgi:hypothetical protein